MEQAMTDKVLDYVALDLETTGLSPRDDRIIEIGAVKYIGGVRTDSFACFVNPDIHIPERITEITGIDDSMVSHAEYIDTALAGLLDFLGDMPVLGHNVAFDYGFSHSDTSLFLLVFKPNGNGIGMCSQAFPICNQYNIILCSTQGILGIIRIAGTLCKACNAQR